MNDKYQFYSPWWVQCTKTLLTFWFIWTGAFSQSFSWPARCYYGFLGLLLAAIIGMPLFAPFHAAILLRISAMVLLYSLASLILGLGEYAQERWGSSEEIKNRAA
jgi:hypothetical protein